MHEGQPYRQIALGAVMPRLALAGIAACALACQVPGSERMELFRESQRLTARDAEVLEQRLVEEPGDVRNRTMLLLYYGRSVEDAHGNARRAVHTLWLIKNAPETEVLQTAHARLTQFDRGAFASDEERDALYARMEASWLRQLEAHPDNPSVIRNAAQFSWLSDPERRLALLERGGALEPMNPDWPEKVGHELHDKAWASGEPPDAAIASLALAQFERARELSNPDSLLVPLARTAFHAGVMVKARRYAEAAVAAAGDRMVGGDREGHYGNILLGQIALREGKIEEARERLLTAAEFTGGTGVHRPNMALARDLLQEGEPAVVLEYFARCADSWPRGKEKLSRWTVEIEAGEIPDFGSSLRF